MGIQKRKVVERENRRDEVMRLTLAGYFTRQIAKLIGVSHTTVENDITARLHAAAAECKDTRDYREIQRQRLSVLRKAWWDRAVGQPASETAAEIPPDPDAFNAIMKLEIRESKLLGTDEPKEVKHSGAIDLNLRPDFSQLTPAELSALRDVVTKVQPAEAAE